MSKPRGDGRLGIVLSQDSVEKLGVVCDAMSREVGVKLNLGQAVEKLISEAAKEASNKETRPGKDV